MEVTVCFPPLRRCFFFHSPSALPLAPGCACGDALSTPAPCRIRLSNNSNASSREEETVASAAAARQDERSCDGGVPCETGSDARELAATVCCCDDILQLCCIVEVKRKRIAALCALCKGTRSQQDRASVRQRTCTHSPQHRTRNRTKRTVTCTSHSTTCKQRQKALGKERKGKKQQNTTCVAWSLAFTAVKRRLTSHELQLSSSYSHES